MKISKLKVIKIFICTVITTFFLQTTIFAENIGASKIAKGTEKLLEDATTWLLVIAPIVTIVALGYFFIRKGISDEIDHKKWNVRLTTAVISCVGVISASVIVKVILSYYK